VGWDTNAARLLPAADGVATVSLDEVTPQHTIERAMPRHP
jgi:hypothetical protein